MTADRTAGLLMERLLDDMPLPDGSEVSVLVNGLGGTPAEELFIVYRRVARILEERGVKVFIDVYKRQGYSRVHTGRVHTGRLRGGRQRLHAGRGDNPHRRFHGYRYDRIQEGGADGALQRGRSGR